MPLPVDTGRFVGEPTVMVVAETLYQAKQAAEAVDVEWEQLPAISRALDAVRENAPLLWENIPSNLALDAEIGSAEATARAFEKAKHRISFATSIQRVTGAHMEPRAFVACVELGHPALHDICISWSRYHPYACGSRQGARRRREPDTPRRTSRRRRQFRDTQRYLSRFYFAGMGGAQANRPVKYTAERVDAMLSDFQGRDLHVDAELALGAEGQFLALRSVNTSNVGAYTTSFVSVEQRLCN